MTRHHTTIAFVIFLFAGIACALSAAAEQSFRLQIVTGLPGQNQVELSLEELDALDQSDFTTTTIWTDGDIRFSGVSLKHLLESVGAQGKNINMIALNDYQVTMAFDDLEADAPIVATRMNGEPMSVRDKGPYWVVFPYDSHRKYRTEPVYALSIWQLSRLEIVD
jgi:hypothetical protein